MLSRKKYSTLDYRNIVIKYFLFTLISFLSFILLSCKSENKTGEIRNISEVKLAGGKGTVADFDISGLYIAGIAGGSFSDLNYQTGFYPNTFPKANVRLEILQLYPNWREITVKLHARFYDKSTSGSAWSYKGRFLGMGTGTLVLSSGSTDAGSYVVNFLVEDYFIDSSDLPTNFNIKFTFSGKVSQFSTYASSTSSGTAYLALTGTMTIDDINHKVFSTNTTTKKFAAKRWCVENFQPFNN